MKIATVPFLLLCALLLALPGTAGADQTAIQVSATILSRCQVGTARVETRGQDVMASTARCNGAGEALPYRVSVDGLAASTATLPRNAVQTVATGRHGRVVTLEF